MLVAAIAGLACTASLFLLVAAFRRPAASQDLETAAIGLGGQPGSSPRQDASRIRFSDRIARGFGTKKPSTQQNLRLAGTTELQFAMQRFGGLVVGCLLGSIVGVVRGSGLAVLGVTVVLATLVGWWFPNLPLRDNSAKARAEIDEMMQQWVVLVAQQITAGVEPDTAMLNAARAGHRASWRLLYRYLLGARQERRACWEGLVTMSGRYGIHSMTPVIAALGLAVSRGTRIADAIIGAADSLWDDRMQAEREKASKQSQLIVFPAAAVALGLAAILIYPPFMSLSGGLTGL